MRVKEEVVPALGIEPEAPGPKPSALSTTLLVLSLLSYLD